MIIFDLSELNSIDAKSSLGNGYYIYCPKESVTINIDQVKHDFTTNEYKDGTTEYLRDTKDTAIVLSNYSDWAFDKHPDECFINDKFDSITVKLPLENYITQLKSLLKSATVTTINTKKWTGTNLHKNVL